MEMLEGLFFIQRGFLSGNHFAYRAEEPILIDTAYASEIPRTLASLEALGVDWRRTSRILCTHAHCDHVGANRVIQEASGCEVALHRVGKRFIDEGDRWSTWWDYYGQEAELFQCARGLEDGEELPVGPHRFRVVHTPGHSADGIVLYEPRSRVLLSADTLWERDMPVVTEAVEGDGAVEALLSSLERIAGLEVNVVFPGHGSPFTDVRGALVRAEGRLRGYLRDRTRLGEDLLKRILVYTLLMRGAFPEAELFPFLVGSRWFQDAIGRYFGADSEGKYRETLDGLRRRGAVRVEAGRVLTTVPP